MGLVSVYETEFVFRSLMAWGKKLFLSLSVPVSPVSPVNLVNLNSLYQV